MGIREYEEWLRKVQAETDETNENDFPLWPWARTEDEQCTVEDDGELGGSPTRCELISEHEGHPHAAVYWWGG